MNTIQMLYHLALSDFHERTRRVSFLLVLAAVVYMGIMVNDGKLSIQLTSVDPNSLIHAYRGEFNSAWIGTMTALVINSFLGLFGFYLVNDCIKRDIRTGVGQIIATTPICRPLYLIGKWISNCIVLFAFVFILAAAAAVMVLLKRESVLDPFALLMPLLSVTLPYMMLVGAFAVVFETIPWLRGSIGNVIYFFLWVFSLSSLMLMNVPLFQDPLGINIFRNDLKSAAKLAFPDETIGALSIGGFPTNQLEVFYWPGLVWDPGIIFGQLVWVLFGMGLILISARWFSRFDPSREGLRRQKSKRSKEGIERNRTIFGKDISQIRLPVFSQLISQFTQMNPFFGVLFAELRMILYGRRWWWWSVVIGLNIAILTNPISTTKLYLLPIAWLWPLPIFSEIGNREYKNHTHQMVFTSPRPVLRQLPAAWLAGVLGTAFFGFSGLLVFLLRGDLISLVGWFSAVIFIPSLALALGVFSSGSRVFEIFYMIWWYLGPLQKTSGLDFTSGMPFAYLSLSAVLLIFSAYWRSRQVRM